MTIMGSRTKRSKVRRITGIIMGIMVLLLLLGGVYVMERDTYVDANAEVITSNPLMGFAIRGDYAEDLGDNSLVYIDVLWKEIEPEKGVYDFSKLYRDFHIEKRRADGQKAVLRFLCDLPGQEAHRDIPDWLYEETKDGSTYHTSYGQGYAPNYANAVFIEAHQKALQAIAKEFAEDHFLAYIELGSLGHWGEWHVLTESGIAPLPTEEVCMEYVTHYREAFPEVQLLMRRPFLGVKEYGLGVYNDMLGNRSATDEWLTWLFKGGVYTEPADTHRLYGNEKFYEQGAVGGEFTSGTSWEEMLEYRLEDTIDMIEASHMTFIGPKVPLEERYTEQADTILARLGYQLGISKAGLCYNRLFHSLRITCHWNNQGIAPMYYNWPVYLYFYGAEGTLLTKEQVMMDVTKIMPGKSVKVSWQGQVDWEKVASIGIGIEDPDREIPCVTLNNATNEGKVTILFSK